MTSVNMKEEMFISFGKSLVDSSNDCCLDLMEALFRGLTIFFFIEINVK